MVPYEWYGVLRVRLDMAGFRNSIPSQVSTQCLYLSVCFDLLLEKVEFVPLPPCSSAATRLTLSGHFGQAPIRVAGCDTSPGAFLLPTGFSLSSTKVMLYRVISAVLYALCHARKLRFLASL